jgi:hypothetical protein
MPQPPANTADQVPRWIVIVGSVLIAGFLLAVPMPAPRFAQSVHEITGPNILQPLRMTHNYHFLTNNPRDYAVFFIVNLKDEKGQEMKSIRIPDPAASSAVQYRQKLLARWLTMDEPVVLPQSEVVPAPDQKAPEVQYWDMNQPQKLMLVTKPQHLVPRDRPFISAPSAVQLMLAQAYVRYLCHSHGAASGEIIRHARMPIPPDVLTQDNVQGMMFDEFTSNYGEFSR